MQMANPCSAVNSKSHNIAIINVTATIFPIQEYKLTLLLTEHTQAYLAQAYKHTSNQANKSNHTNPLKHTLKQTLTHTHPDFL